MFVNEFVMYCWMSGKMKLLQIFLGNFRQTSSIFEKFEKCSETFVWPSNNNLTIFGLEIAQTSKVARKEQSCSKCKGKKGARNNYEKLPKSCNLCNALIQETSSERCLHNSLKPHFWLNIRTLFLRHYLVEIFLYVKNYSNYNFILPMHLYSFGEHTQMHQWLKIFQCFVLTGFVWWKGKVFLREPFIDLKINYHMVLI